jgi:hypothetical protein
LKKREREKETGKRNEKYGEEAKGASVGHAPEQKRRLSCRRVRVISSGWFASVFEYLHVPSSTLKQP